MAGHAVTGVDDNDRVTICRRASYPRGRNVVVSPGVAELYHTRAGSLVVRVMDCRHLAAEPSATN